MMTRTFSILSLGLMLFSAAPSDAQNTVELQLYPLYNGVPLVANQTFTDVNAYQCRVTRLQFYLHDFVIEHDGGQTTNLSTSDNYVLADFNETFFMAGSGTISTVESLSFDVGVDTSLNHDDPSAYAAGHPLGNHTPSMHWGWSAGYKFLVIEMDVDTDNDGTFETGMQSHVVGDQFIKTVSPITISNSIVEQDTVKVALTYDLAKWLDGVDVSTAGSNHGGGTVNGTIMGNTDPKNVFAQGTVTDMQVIEALSANIYTAYNTLYFSSEFAIDEIEVFDLSGKRVINSPQATNSGAMPYDLAPGVYVVRLRSGDTYYSRKLKF